MKPKTIFYPWAALLLLTSHASGQVYTEIFEGGWGQGRESVRPCFTDLDNNGRLDLILGESEGCLHHLEQDSSGSKNFSSISVNFSGINVGTKSAPTFTDLDNDGLLDLIIGRMNGNISRYEQDSVGSTTFSLLSENFNEIDIGSNATPRFIDLDNDGLLDMIVGEEMGTLNHYEQAAISSANFYLKTENFNGIDVGHLSTPCFTDLDDDELIDMLVGEHSGHLHHYEQVSSGSTEFGLISDNFNQIDMGAQTCPIFTDLDNDGLLDLMIGDMAGNLSNYEQEASGSVNFFLISHNILPGIDIGLHSAPSFTDLDNDELWDLIVGENNGTLTHFEQEAVGSPFFSFLTDTLWGIDVGLYSNPIFIDLDNDELLDMIIGDYSGTLSHYEQDAAGSLSFTHITSSFNDISLEDACAPTFTDLNADGLYDMIIGRGDGTLCHYSQDTFGSMSFSLISENFNNIDMYWFAKPSFTHLDDDGFLDMIIGESMGALYHYEQDAIGSSNFNLISESFLGIDSGFFSSPTFVDINGDGLEDLLVGAENGGIRYFQRIDDTSVEQESRDLISFGMISNYPNPFNSSTHIRYNLQKLAKVQITIYNTLGQKVRLLENRYKSAGSHTIQWDGTDEHGRSLSSGLYICRMQADVYSESIKLLLVK